MITNSQWKALTIRAARLHDDRIDKALRWALVEQDYRHNDPRLSAEHIDAWVMALRLEKARRAANPTGEGDELARRWPQIARYRDQLLKLGLNVSVLVEEMPDHLVVTLTVNGEPGTVTHVADSWKTANVPDAQLHRVGVVQIIGDE